ncbi:MAG: BlaI/MecI/CopY family transcriptional regulator [Candidatus Hydrogenedentales bacterium]
MADKKKRSKKQSRRPTEAELDVLAFLWERGPSTVREVHDSLRARKATGYTTTLKTMQIMAEKGLLQRDEKARSHVYRTTVSRETARRGFVRDLADRLFGGSPGQLILHALKSEGATPEELAELRALLDRHDAKRK